jgi:hypothetical protein
MTYIKLTIAWTGYLIGWAFCLPLSIILNAWENLSMWALQVRIDMQSYHRQFWAAYRGEVRK